MEDFMADKNERRSIFDSFKFWGHRPNLKDSLSPDIEKSPIIMIEDLATDNTFEDLATDNTFEDLATDNTIGNLATDNTIEDVETADSPKEKRDESNPSNVRLYETISGNFIITRGWDGNNMQVYKMRRKNY
ncbi:hypothetical protein F4694_000859 [Bacillus niacini]|uniref:Uncharacterized protein n=1 Tax=Neobacillus niacini TaxID=86668 RepID=A0A852T8H5_9BACI|nr:hypothetical protein [Neobacillus niacini]NYE04115.1 hypothetical protein [Neobacillus niacini]